MDSGGRAAIASATGTENAVSPERADSNDDYVTKPDDLGRKPVVAKDVR